MKQVHFNPNNKTIGPQVTLWFVENMLNYKISIVLDHLWCDWDIHQCFVQTKNIIEEFRTRTITILCMAAAVVLCAYL